MKKLLASLLCVAMVFVMAVGCAAPEAQPQATEAVTVPEATNTPAPAPEKEVETEAMYSAGTYEGEGTGRNGPIRVSVTFSDDMLTDVVITEHAETPGISDPAIERIPAAVVESQSLAVAAVSGATLTYGGIMTALEDALTKAGCDIAAWKAAPVQEAEKKTDVVEKSVDVVVVGGGGAGMAAAISAAENGATVVLLEKTAVLGGNTVRSGGAYNAVDPARQHLIEMTDTQKATVEGYITAEPKDDIEAELQKLVKADFDAYLLSGETGLFDSVNFHILQTYLGGDYMADIELITTLCNQSPVTLKWLEDNGFTWKPETFTIVGATWPRSHQSDKSLTGIGFIEALNNAADKYPIEFLMETPANELITDAAGAVVGVKAQNVDGTSYVINVNKGVILTCGGFGSNMEMIRKYRPDILETTPTTNSPAITGDGILMAEAVGAQLVDMDLIQLYPLASAVTGDTAYGMVGPTTAMYVNPKGERYVNEYERRDVLAQAAFDQGGVIYCISDSVGAQMRDPEGIENAIKTGGAYKADTLEELAVQLGMDPAVLVDTVNKFNSYADQGYDPDFGRNTFDSNVKVVEGPFYASPRSPSIHHCMGGVKINTEGRVINTEGEIIPGLFAAGEVTGDIHGNNRLGGNAVPDALTFGRIAGATASK